MDRDRSAESIGERLRRLRLDRGLSQRELSAPGVSYAYISRIEAGTRRPSVKALRELARKLSVSAEYLETGSEMRDVDERELRLADAELQLRLTTDFTEAERSLTEILFEATDAGDVASATRARVGLGLAAFARASYGEAAARLEEAIRTDAVSPVSRPDVYATLGRCYAVLGTPERAADLFETCLSDAYEQAPEDVSIQVRFATLLSYALTDMGDPGRAHTVLGETLARAQDAVDPYTRVRLYWSMARLAEHDGSASTALEYVRRAIALLEATDNTLSLGRAHLMCASIMISQEKVLQAGQHLDLAQRLFATGAEPADLAWLRTEQAKRATRLGRPDEAVDAAREALELLGSDNPGARGRVFWALAEALALEGDHQGAADAFRSSIDLLSTESQWRDASLASRAFGKFLRRLGRESEALDVLEHAADLAERARPAAAASPVS
jgi:transcriptional regulator with XRE-family HTH domain